MQNPGPFAIAGLTPPDPDVVLAYLQNDDDLDVLPSGNMTWNETTLLANTATNTIPPIILFSDADSPEIKDSIWSNLYFQPHARALLRHRLRVAYGGIGFSAAALGGDRTWDERGGVGGVWTRGAINEGEEDSSAREEWKSWGEICSGKRTIRKSGELLDGDHDDELLAGAKVMMIEELVFADGKGLWGKEKSDHVERNRWGQVVREGNS